MRTKDLRHLIEKKRIEISSFLRDIEIEKSEISPNLYDEKSASDVHVKLDILSLYDKFLIYKKNTIEIRTYQKYETVKTILAEFIKHYKKGRIYIPDIDKQFWDSFTKYLSVQKNHAVTTINKYQSCLNSFFEYLAEDLRLILDGRHRKFKIISRKKESESKVILFKEHIGKLIKWKPADKRYEIVRDYFLFLVFTGIRYSDMVRVNKSFVKNNSLSFTMFKTSTYVSVPLHTQAKKYWKSIITT